MNEAWARTTSRPLWRGRRYTCIISRNFANVHMQAPEEPPRHRARHVLFANVAIKASSTPFHTVLMQLGYFPLLPLGYHCLEL